LSNNAAAALTKRKPRAVSSRGFDPKIGEIVHGKSKSALGQRGKAFVLDRAHVADRVLGELEHQRWCERAVGLDKLEQLRKPGIGQRCG
jgi:hypothetical protein